MSCFLKTVITDYKIIASSKHKVAARMNILYTFHQLVLHFVTVLRELNLLVIIPPLFIFLTLRRYQGSSHMNY